MSPYRFRIDRITDVHVLRGQIVIGCNVISGPGYVHVRPLFLSHRSMTMMLTGQKEEVHPQSSLALSTNLFVCEGTSRYTSNLTIAAAQRM